MISLPKQTEDDEEESETEYLRRFRYLAKLRIHFWNHWRKKCLIKLKEHHRNKGENNHKVHEGELVLVHKDNGKRSNWNMGKTCRRTNSR